MASLLTIGIFLALLVLAAVLIFKLIKKIVKAVIVFVLFAILFTVFYGLAVDGYDIYANYTHQSKLAVFVYRGDIVAAFEYISDKEPKVPINDLSEVRTRLASTDPFSDGKYSRVMVFNDDAFTKLTTVKIRDLDTPKDQTLNFLRAAYIREAWVDAFLDKFTDNRDRVLSEVVAAHPSDDSFRGYIFAQMHTQSSMPEFPVKQINAGTVVFYDETPVIKAIRYAPSSIFT